MALVTNITKEIRIPGEDETAVIRKLSHKQIKEASKARQSESFSNMREMGGELLKALRDTKDTAEETTRKLKEIQDRQAADVSNYDRDVLLKYGIVSWSYAIAPMAISKDGVSNGLDELDEPTAKFLAEAIFEFSRPETGAEAKKDLSASISS